MKIERFNENNIPDDVLDVLEGRDFYELLQIYRHTKVSKLKDVKNSFEDIKSYIRENFLVKDEKIVKEWLLENDAKKYNI